MHKSLGLVILAASMMMAVPAASAQEANADMMRVCMLGMDSMDADGDGAISKKEFMQANNATFAAMDQDGNGALSVQEREMTTGQVVDALLANAKALWSSLWGMLFG